MDASASSFEPKVVAPDPSLTDQDRSSIAQNPDHGTNKEAGKGNTLKSKSIGAKDLKQKGGSSGSLSSQNHLNPGLSGKSSSTKSAKPKEKGESSAVSGPSGMQRASSTGSMVSNGNGNGNGRKSSKAERGWGSYSGGGGGGGGKNSTSSLLSFAFDDTDDRFEDHGEYNTYGQGQKGAQKRTTSGKKGGHVRRHWLHATTGYLFISICWCVISSVE